MLVFLHSLLFWPCACIVVKFVDLSLCLYYCTVCCFGPVLVLLHSLWFWPCACIIAVCGSGPVIYLVIDPVEEPWYRREESRLKFLDVIQQ